jgi:hypothetical protein
MKALVSAFALLSFVAAATIPAVAYADDAPASTTKAKKHTSKSTKPTKTSSTKKSSKKKAD